jgi:hypothetical protein
LSIDAAPSGVILPIRHFLKARLGDAPQVLQVQRLGLVAGVQLAVTLNVDGESSAKDKSYGGPTWRRVP